MAKILTAEVLKDSIKHGVRGVRDVLSKEEAEADAAPQMLERGQQVERARSAIRFLRGELSALNATEKKRVIEASREVIQNALDGVSGEVQQEQVGARAKEKLNSLESEQKNFAQAREEVVKLELELSNLKEQVGIGTREVAREIQTAFKERDWKTLALYAVSIAGAAAAAKWIWDHSIGWLWGKASGSKEKPGFLRKAAAFVVVAGGAIAGAIGLNRLRHKPSSLLPSQLIPEILKPAVNFAGDAVDGASKKIQDHVDIQANAAAKIPEAVGHLIEGDLSGALKAGWSFVKTETGWVIDNGLQVFAIPAHLVANVNTQMSASEMGELYGATGVTYVLGRASIKAMLTGKIRVPLTLRSVGMTALRIGAYPAMVLRDGIHVFALGFSTDGRVVARTTLQRWFILGAIQDARYARMAKKADIKSVQKALAHWQGMNRDIGALERQLEGIFKGSVSAESLQAMKNAKERLANSLTKAAARLVEEYGKLGKAVPSWLMELKHAGNLSEQDLVCEEVDRAAKTLFSDAGETSGFAADEFSRALSGESASVDDLLRELSHVDDAERVALAKNLLSLGEEAPTLKHLLSLDSVRADDLLKAGQRVEDIVTAANELEDARRLACWDELIRADVSPDILRKCGVVGEELSQVTGKASTGTSRARAGAPEQGTPLRKAAGDGVVGPKPQAAESVTPKGDGFNPKVVRRDGSVVDAAGRTIIEGEVATNLAKDGTKGAAAAVEGTEKTAAAVRSAEALKLKQVNALLENREFLALTKTAGVEASEVRSILLATPEFNADALIRISRDAGARKLLAGAMAVPQEARAKEVGRVLGIAKNSKVLIGVDIAGAGLDVFGVVMAANDFIANEGKIRDTQNEQLRAMYATTRWVILGEGATNLGGLVMGGMFIGAEMAKGATLWTALATAGTWVMLPIGMAAGFARMTHERLVASAEYHILSERELLPYSPGALLHEIGSTAPGKPLNYGQKFASVFHLPDGGKYDWELANRGARDERYRAYFAQIAARVVPQVTSLDLPFADVQGRPEAEILRTVAVRQTNEYRRFVANAMAYLRIKTGAAFTEVTPAVLHDAQLYAQHCPADRWGLTPDQMDAAANLATTEANSEKKNVEEHLLSLVSHPTRFQEEFPVFCFQYVRHELAAAESGLLGAGYTGLDESARNRARGYLARRVWDALHDLHRRARTDAEQLTTTDMESLVKTVRALLARKPDKLSLEARASGHASFYERTGADPYLLTVDGLAQYCDRYHFVRPETLGATERDAVPKESLDLYYGERMRGTGAPMLLTLPPGKTEGFLSIHEVLWMRSKLTGECTKVGEEGITKAIALSPGYHQFWYERSMPSVNDAQPTVPSSGPWAANIPPPRIRILPTPTRHPDFEIIVQESGKQTA